MSKPKPKLKSKATPAASKPAARAGGKSIVESAQHIWLAGLGAFAKAQDEGTRLFEALVREGVSLEQKTRKMTAGKAEEARGAVEAAVGQVKERSQETWDKLEKVFETRVSRALNHLGVPGSAAQPARCRGSRMNWPMSRENSSPRSSSRSVIKLEKPKPANLPRRSR